MKNFFTLSVLCLLTHFVLWCAPTYGSQALFIFSMDGLSLHQLKKFDPEFVKTQGVQGITPPFPSTTFAGHTTLMTGKEPWEHGIVDNHFYDGEKKFKYNNEPEWLLSEPLWTTAMGWGGWEVETFLWPSSYGPWNGKPHTRYQKEFTQLPFENIKAAALDSLAKWDRKNNLLYISWTPGIDKDGHIYGPLSEKVKTSWSKLKEEILDFQSKLRAYQMAHPQDPVRVIYVADHGMDDSTHHVLLLSFLTHFNQMNVKYVSSGCLVYIYQKLEQKLLDQIKIPITWHKPKHPRQGIHFGELGKGYSFVTELTPECKKEKIPWVYSCPQPLGMHGWVPQGNPRMTASLWAWPKKPKSVRWPKKMLEFKTFVKDFADHQ